MVGAILMGPASSQAVEGRYLVTFARTNVEGAQDVLRQRYDVGTRESTFGGWDLSLRMSLIHQDNLDVGDPSFLRSRFFGDLRSQTLRFRTQFEPWQDNGFGSSGRQRSYRLGMDLTPADRPSLNVDYVRRDRDGVLGRSWQEDTRVATSYGRRGVQSGLSFRNVLGAGDSQFTASNRTQEWRGNLQSEAVRGPWRARAGYDALYSEFRSRDRERDLLAHHINVDTSLRLGRRVNVTGTARTRYGHSDDNAQTARRNIREETLSLGTSYEPGFGLRLHGSREYRRQRLASGNLISDYLRFEGIFRRSLYRLMVLQTGYLKTIDLKETEIGQVPRSAAYAFVDGPLRRGVSARAELGASFSGGRDTGTWWRRRLELRTQPRRNTQLDVQWRKDTLPEIGGLSQVDEEWYLTMGYAATQSLNFVASLRELDGTGRIARTEQEKTFTTNLRLARRSSLGVYWSRRDTRGATFRGDERKIGADLVNWLPREFKLQLSWNDISGNRLGAGTSYSATLTKQF